MPVSRRHLAVALALAVLLAGCSGAPVPAPGGTATSTPTPTVAGPPPSPDEPGGNGTFSVHFVNVGQGSATLLVGPTGETLLVDTGDFTDEGRHVLDYLRRQGIDRLDALVSTHADADHIGGNAAVIEYYETEAGGVGTVYDSGLVASTRTYERYLDAVETHDVPLYVTHRGDEIPLAGVDVDVLGPPETPLAGGDRNENSVVLRASFGETSVLLTGDAEDAGESTLVRTEGAALRSTVLAVGHHGSRGSTDPVFLGAVDPRVAVISSAADSRYGHPHAETLSRLADRSVRTYWTATHGHVVLVSDGARTTVATQRAAPTDPVRLREGDPVPPGTTDPVTARVTVDATDGATTPPVTDGGRDQGGLRLVTVHADAEGDDRNNLDDEYLVLANGGTEPLDLSGWTVADAAGATYTVPAGTTLAPGATLTLHTGAGTDTATDLYWGSTRPVWNNDGDTVIVTTANGERVLTEGYA
ncbi:lamin tail domain-containing protein [Haloplanus litoreus]|uniref:Lamin tail domain-containing protein n=1 Tax=Haloplanus litoreus TaxID=767515 RepID=A0ABD5ZU53_9EURY